MKFSLASSIFVAVVMVIGVAHGTEAAVKFPIEGTVGDVVSDSAYMYLRVEQGGESCWVATVAGAYRPGVSVGIEDGVPMAAYTSSELDRTFDVIVFADRVVMRGGGVSMPTHASPELPPGHPPIGPMGAKSTSHSAECPVSHGETEPADGMSGTVVQTMDAAGYTYVQVKTDDGLIWAATSLSDMEVGVPVVIPQSMVMKNFESRALGKTFEEIYFVDSIYVGKGKSASKSHDGGACCPEHGAGVEAVPVEVPADGLTISDLYDQREQLAGTKAVVRGTIVKVSKNIMGKNWMHIDDGTLPGGDLTVTTSGDAFEAGQTVTLSGVVAVDVNIGPHYDYPLILEDAVEIE